MCNSPVISSEARNPFYTREEDHPTGADKLLAVHGWAFNIKLW